MIITYKVTNISRSILFLSLVSCSALATTVPISQDPVLKSTSVPGNVSLALSVEFPTALVNAHKDTNFNTSYEYLGYFDPKKCYKYNKNTTNQADSYFEPVYIKSSYKDGCGQSTQGKWNGNFLNWAVTSTIDPFRWVMTGGNRSVDTEDKTFLLKSYDNGRSYDNNEKRYFPDRSISTNTIEANTGLTSNRYLVIYKEGNYANFKKGSNKNAADDKYHIQVQVCKEGFLEENCKEYNPSNNKKIWKPEGLIQKYHRDLRFSGFSYLNDDSSSRAAGVLRAPMRFLGPDDEFSPDRKNKNSEWDPNTGIFYKNPVDKEATQTNTDYGLTNSSYTIKNSGLINYINKFGQETKQYKFRDPVSGLYYAATRYFQGKQSESSWQNIAAPWGETNAAKIQEHKFLTLDAFPVIKSWSDPIEFSCQKNSILGIGDIFAQESTKLSDEFNLTGSDLDLKKEYDKDSIDYTAPEFSWIADIAYYNNTKGIRPVTDGGTRQTLQTYWVDVVEDGIYRLNNQYYRAAKYGGPLEWKSGEKIKLYKKGSTEKSHGDEHTVDRPRNYFLAGNPASMKVGLEEAFEKMSWDAKNLSTTAFSFTNNDLTHNKTYYSVSYDSQYWSANIKAHKVDDDGKIEIDETTNQPNIIWQTQNKFAKTIKNDYTKRTVLTWSWKSDPNNDSPTILNYDNLSTLQKKSLDTSYVTGDDSQSFTNWLLGNSSDNRYRSRLGAPDANNVRSFNPLGDIINSKIIASTAPTQPYSEADNPGYKAFKETHKDRETILFVGANDGMLHGIRTAANQGGEELFAYMPSSFFLPEAGSPANTTEAVITQLGKHYYNHRHYVEATVALADVDFERAGKTDHEGVGEESHDWRTILVGGLGAGGYQYFAIDVTKPNTFLNPNQAPQNLLWEFPRRDQIPQLLGGQCSTNCIDIGMTFGTPNIIKTKKYGWVVAVTSGYNNASGKGKLYLLNPENGNVLETHVTTSASNGLAHTTAFMPNFASAVADTIYVGDINGQVWRFDLTGNTAAQPDGTYPAHLLAKLTSAGTTAKQQPVTTRPIVQVHPKDRKRYVLIGTGRLLNTSDMEDAQEQSFYALIDGTAGRVSTKPTPITRSELGRGGPEAVMANTATVTEDGWVMDLGTGTAQKKTLGWRNIFSASVAGGNVTFSSILPIANYCEGTGSSRVYAMDFMRGSSIILNNTSETVPYITKKYVNFDTQFVRFDNKINLWTGGGDSQIEVEDKLKLTQEKKGQLSWREIPVTH